MSRWLRLSRIKIALLMAASIVVWLPLMLLFQTPIGQFPTSMLDQRAEPFVLRLPSLSPGPHVVTVRAFDAADNVGSARVTVQIGR